MPTPSGDQAILSLRSMKSGGSYGRRQAPVKDSGTASRRERRRRLPFGNLNHLAKPPHPTGCLFHRYVLVRRALGTTDRSSHSSTPWTDSDLSAKCAHGRLSALKLRTYWSD